MKLETSCPEAAHDFSARSYLPRCFPGTRKQDIEDIVHWAVPRQRHPCADILEEGNDWSPEICRYSDIRGKAYEYEKLGTAFFFLD